MAKIVEKSFPWMIIIAAVLCAIALIGVMVLLCMRIPVPSELWTILIGGFAFFLGGTRAKSSDEPAQG